MRPGALLLLALLLATTQAASQTRCRSGQVEMLIGGRGGTLCDGEPRTAAATPVSLRESGDERGDERIRAPLQRQRDDERLAILRQELAHEQALLARLHSQRPADAAAHARSRANVEALQREIARVPRP